MRSPFPGMDPYLEHSEVWPDLHTSLINLYRELLAEQVGPGYWVGVKRRVLVEAETGEERGWIRPDVSIESTPSTPAPRSSASSSDPSVVAVQVTMEEPFEEPYLLIRDLRSRLVVTVIELISPTNKMVGAGRSEYLSKRAEVLRTRTSLMEIDLLREGRRMPFRGDLGSCDYCACWFRGWERPHGWAKGWSVRDPLPTLPVPLRQGEPEALLDLGKALHLAYERNRYERLIDYSRPASPPLSEADHAWAQELVSSRGGSRG